MPSRFPDTVSNCQLMPPGSSMSTMCSLCSLLSTCTGFNLSTQRFDKSRMCYMWNSSLDSTGFKKALYLDGWYAGSSSLDLFNGIPYGFQISGSSRSPHSTWKPFRAFIRRGSTFRDFASNTIDDWNDENARIMAHFPTVAMWLNKKLSYPTSIQVTISTMTDIDPQSEKYPKRRNNFKI